MSTLYYQYSRMINFQGLHILWVVEYSCPLFKDKFLKMVTLQVRDKWTWIDELYSIFFVKNQLYSKTYIRKLKSKIIDLIMPLYLIALRLFLSYGESEKLLCYWYWIIWDYKVGKKEENKSPSAVGYFLYIHLRSLERDYSLIPQYKGPGLKRWKNMTFTFN